MKILAVIDTRWNSAYARRPWLEYSGTLQAVQEKVRQTAEKVMLLGSKEEIPAEISSNPEEIYTALQNNCGGFDAVLYVYADEPFLDLDLTKKMLENHERYFADFSFAEGYPQGLTGQIISTGILPDLIALASKNPLGKQTVYKRSFFFETLKNDLNNFSIETEISPVDLRALRLQLNYQNKNHSEICTKILNSGARTSAEILEKVQEHPDLLWGCPSYYNIQISGNCPQKCSYCPYACHEDFGKDIFMTQEDFRNILEQASELSQEAVISLSYMGEAALHPDFCSMMSMVADNPDFSLHIETSGIGWSEEAWKTLIGLDRRRVSLIISLDSIKESLYKKVRGEGFEEVMAFTRRALEEFKENTWIQCVRRKPLESELEPFYRHFQELKAQVIFQKYNNFCGSLPDEKSVNIAPLKRHVCWALQREISIRADGNVLLCASSLSAEVPPIGNAMKDGLKNIWENMNARRLQHARKEYPAICRNCDEYYIFNF